MTAVLAAPAPSVPRRGASPVAHFGPNWFVTVMGTGIVANAAALLPVDVPGLDVLARGMWVLAVVVLVVVGAATAAHWLTHPDAARGHLAHPVMSHFHGAPAMALMTVGAGALLVGHELVGWHAAIALDTVLWSAGTALGLWTLVAIPCRTFRSPAPYAGPAFGGWLMPVVPPMVSAATGPLLIPHVATGLRPPIIAGCYLMFSAALAASVPLITVIVRRALRGQIGAALTVPTLFIVVGPLGQSVTAAHALGERAGGLWATFGVAYGLPVATLAVGWLVVAAAVTARSARTGLPFGLTWWSFTFPVGTVVTGTSGLATATGSVLFGALAVGLFLALVAAWALVAALTLRGVWSGDLLHPPTGGPTGARPAA
ncbi:MAG: C4-dicarboxylate ABC transporter [Aeromicrobium sp.]